MPHNKLYGSYKKMKLGTDASRHRAPGEGAAPGSGKGTVRRRTVIGTKQCLHPGWRHWRYEVGWLSAIRLRVRVSAAEQTGTYGERVYGLNTQTTSHYSFTRGSLLLLTVVQFNPLPA